MIIYVFFSKAEYGKDINYEPNNFSAIVPLAITVVMLSFFVSHMDQFPIEEWTRGISLPKMYKQRKLNFLRDRFAYFAEWILYIAYSTFVLLYVSNYSMQVPSYDG